MSREARTHIIFGSVAISILIFGPTLMLTLNTKKKPIHEYEEVKLTKKTTTATPLPKPRPKPAPKPKPRPEPKTLPPLPAENLSKKKAWAIGVKLPAKWRYKNNKSLPTPKKGWWAYVFVGKHHAFRYNPNLEIWHNANNMFSSKDTTTPK